MSDFELFGEIAEKAAAANVATQADLIASANEAVKLEGKIADLEALLSAMKSRLNAIKTSVIPTEMLKLGQIAFTLSNGFKIEVEDFIVVQDIKDRTKKEAMREKRIVALTGMEGGSELVKTEVFLPFGRKEHNEALALVGELRKRGLTVSVSSDVNVQSLKAFVREKMRAGEKIDTEALGLFIGTTTRITQPRGG